MTTRKMWPGQVAVFLLITMIAASASAYETAVGYLEEVRVKANVSYQALAFRVKNSSGTVQRLCPSAPNDFGYRGTGDAGGEAAVERLTKLAIAAYLGGVKVRVWLNWTNGKCRIEQLAIDD